MTDLENQDLAESAFKAIELACDRINDQTEADIDNQRTGGMIALKFLNRSQIVINLQKPLHEIWMAAKGADFTISSIARAGPIPGTPASCLKTCRAIPVTRRASRWFSSHPPEGPNRRTNGHRAGFRQTVLISF